MNPLNYIVFEMGIRLYCRLWRQTADPAGKWFSPQESRVFDGGSSSGSIWVVRETASVYFASRRGQPGARGKKNITCSKQILPPFS
jgi:hypothetical protein